MFRALLPALHRTGVPALLPKATSLPIKRAYASVLSAKPGTYSVFLSYAKGCVGDACELGTLDAHTRGAAAHRPAGTATTLARGLTGYFVNFNCGASCGESTITVDVHSCRYIFGLKAGSLRNVKKMTNSALSAGAA